MAAAGFLSALGSPLWPLLAGGRERRLGFGRGVGAADAWESGWKRFSSTAAAEVSDDGPWDGDELGVQEVEEDPEDGGGPRGGRGLGIQRSGNGSCRPAFGWLVLAGTTDESGLNQGDVWHQLI
uniref:Uncharacterized protein n=1 Tax=Oryza glumipatula TaxID=40148 RepID=A0A0D9ZNM6_9ORYZ